MAKKKKKKKNYINNKDLLAEIKLSKERGEMTDKFARMMVLLTKRYASQGSYASYTYNDDMQSYALLTICRVWDSFDPKKSNNPFAYFTQTIKRAFWQYMQKEETHRDIRDEILMKHGESPSHSYEKKYNENMFSNEFQECVETKNITLGFQDLLRKLIKQEIGNQEDRDYIYNTIMTNLFSYEIEKNTTPFKFITEKITEIYSRIHISDDDSIMDEYINENNGDDDYDNTD